MKGKTRKIVIGVIIAIVVVTFIAFGTLAILGIFREFNARKFVTGNLDMVFKGEVKTITEMVKDTTEEEQKAQYEKRMESFVTNSLLNGTEIDSELKEKYIELCKKIFAKMEYRVQEAEKINSDEFNVPVKYRPSNVLQLFIASATSEVERMEEKKEKGEYRGTYEEIHAQMQVELFANWYTLLEEAYKNMEYGEEVTVVFKVFKGENGAYQIEENATTEFIVKILSLDEKED